MQEQAPAPAPAGGEGQGGGGDIQEVLGTLGAGLAKVNEVLASADAPDEAKQAFAASLEAFQAGMEIMSGGGAPQQPSSPVTPEQGVSGAQPMSHGRPV